MAARGCAGVRDRVFVGHAEEKVSLVRAFPLQSNPLVFLLWHLPAALPPPNHYSPLLGRLLCWFGVCPKSCKPNILVDLGLQSLCPAGMVQICPWIPDPQLKQLCGHLPGRDVPNRPVSHSLSLQGAGVGQQLPVPANGGHLGWEGR